MPSWSLENADEIAATNKYTFFKSPRETIALVKPGEAAPCQPPRAPCLF